MFGARFVESITQRHKSRQTGRDEVESLSSHVQTRTRVLSIGTISGYQWQGSLGPHVSLRQASVFEGVQWLRVREQQHGGNKGIKSLTNHWNKISDPGQMTKAVQAGNTFLRRNVWITHGLRPSASLGPVRRSGRQGRPRQDSTSMGPAGRETALQQSTVSLEPCPTFRWGRRPENTTRAVCSIVF